MLIQAQGGLPTDIMCHVGGGGVGSFALGLLIGPGVNLIAQQTTAPYSATFSVQLPGPLTAGPNVMRTFGIQLVAMSPLGANLPIQIAIMQGGAILQALDPTGHPMNGAASPFMPIIAASMPPNTAQTIGFGINFE